MKKIIQTPFLIIAVLFFSHTIAAAQDDVRVLHRKLKTEIESTYKKKQLSENEYRKMLEEHGTIGKSIEMALVDGHFSNDEKNKIFGKITRSKKRLVRYKHNNEVY